MEYTQKVRDRILEELEKGRSLLDICADPELPAARTVQRWQNDDKDFDVAVTHARELGFHARADRAVLNAMAAEDAQKGRLAFDAERWYLGKLSNAFSEDKDRRHIHTGPDGGPLVVSWEG